jgi:hypothetical protein
MPLHSRTSSCVVVMASAWAALLSACSQQAPTLEAEVPYLQELSDAVAAGSPEDILALVHFSTFPCTSADGLGGPPKCLPTEAEGTPVEALPILGSEGQHLRRDDFGSWPGIGSSRLHAVVRVEPPAVADEFFPPGDYAVAFLQEDGVNVVVFQITDEGIVRMDYHPRALFDETLDGANVILAPVADP